MNTNETMVNTTTMDTVEEMTASGSGNVLKTMAGTGIVVIGGYIGYKYLIKPGYNKLKNKINQIRNSKKEVVEEAEEVMTFDESEQTEGH